jgi:hypothetical protein
MFTPKGLPGVPTFLDVAHVPAVEAERIVEGFQEADTWPEHAAAPVTP